MRSCLLRTAPAVSVALLWLAVSCSGPAPTPAPEPISDQSIETPEPHSEEPPSEGLPPEDPPPEGLPPEEPPPDALPLEELPPEEPPAEGFQVDLSIEGSTLVMVGDMDIGFYERFLKAVRGREGEIATLRVDSGGGVTDEGRKLGDWIFENSVDVVVDGLCFSSCANYVFTAARNKTILADSIVGWHGSEQQDEHIARGLGVTVEELLGRHYNEFAAEWGETPSPEGRRDHVEEILSTLPAAIREEQEFLAKIGVSADALVYGFLPGQFQDYYVDAPDHIGGWTFSIEDMASFGIDNVAYTGDGDYPSEQAATEYGVVVLKVP